MTEEVGVHNRVRIATEIFVEHENYIKKVIRSKVYDHQLERDLYQEFFLTLVKTPIPNTVKNIRGYLYMILTRDIIDASRQEIRYKKNIQKYAENHRHRKFYIEQDTIENRDEISKVFDAMSNYLSEREMDAVVLRYKLDYTTQEVAEKLSVKPQTVSRYVSVSLSKIRQRLDVNIRG